MLISKEKIKHLKKENEKLVNGYPIFNTCPHHLIDISEKELDNDLGTVSIKIDDNTYIAIGKVGENIVDITVYEKGEHKKENTKMLGIDPRMNRNKNLTLEDFNIYSLMLDKNFKY